MTKDLEFYEEIFRVKSNEAQMMNDRNNALFFRTEETDDPFLLIGNTISEFYAIYESYYKDNFQYIKDQTNLDDDDRRALTANKYRILSNLYINRDTNNLTLVYYLPATKKKIKGTSIFGQQNFEYKTPGYEIKKIINLRKHMFLQNLIIVYKGRISAKSLKTLKNSIVDIPFQVFSLSELSINPTIHILTPIHRKLDEYEKKQILSLPNIKFDQFPKIHTNDPISKWYDFRSGDIIEITRVVTYGEVIVKISIGYRAVTSPVLAPSF